MRRSNRYLTLVGVVSASMLAGPAAAGAASAQAAGGPATSVTWGKISAGTGLGIASAGIYRTADGRLHVVWASHDSASSYSLHYSTLGLKAKEVNTGKAVGEWPGISAYPRLVPGPGGGIRLIFAGGNGVSGSPYNTGAMYSATSGAAGTTWKLAAGSLSHTGLVPLTDTAAANETTGTPVAGWSGGAAFSYHVGIDPASPAKSGDQSVSVGAGGDVVGPAMVRDKAGNIWAAWFNGSFKSSQGYYVDAILPSVKPKLKAPGSGGLTANNQPLGAVALAARVGGGVYLAYCVPTKTVECAHVALWRVGSAKAMAVPGSGTGHATHVAIAAGPGGHLSVAWYDSGLNKIKEVRTNSAASGFGTVRTISAPPGTDVFDGLQLEGSTGPLDVIALTFHLKTNLTAYWATEITP